MLQRYLQAVGRARAQCRAAPRPPLATMAAGWAVLLVFYIIASVLLVPPSEGAAFNFVDEQGAVTALSAICLASAMALAFANYLVGGWPEKHYRMFWLALALTLGFLALDELLQFHERTGDALETLKPLGELVENTRLRNLNDVVVALYGVMAVPVALAFLPGVLRTPYVLRLLLVASGFYVVHTVIDGTAEPETFTSIVCEESAKLFSSGFIALAMLTGLLGTVAELRASRVEPASGGTQDG